MSSLPIDDYEWVLVDQRELFKMAHEILKHLAAFTGGFPSQGASNANLWFSLL